MPAAALPVAADIVEITDAFCAEHLDAEYAELCRALAVKLARNRCYAETAASGPPGSCTRSAGSTSWRIRPRRRFWTERLAELLDVKQTTMGNKGALIRDLLGIGRFHEEFVRQDMIERNLMAWLIEVDGLVMDARSLPVPVQHELARVGIIPYVPEQEQR